MVVDPRVLLVCLCLSHPRVKGIGVLGKLGQVVSGEGYVVIGEVVNWRALLAFEFLWCAFMFCSSRFVFCGSCSLIHVFGIFVVV